MHSTFNCPEAKGRCLLKFARAAHAEGKNWREELNQFLLAYCCRSVGGSHLWTPHSATFLFNVEEEEVEISEQAVRDRDTQMKQSNKEYVDKTIHARDRDVRGGDTVLLEKKKGNKLLPLPMRKRCTR